MTEKTIKLVPIGLKPKEIHERDTAILRFNEVCGAISRYYNACIKIPIIWLEEYNELIGKWEQEITEVHISAEINKLEIK